MPPSTDIQRLTVSPPAAANLLETPLQQHLQHVHVLRPGLHVHADDLVEAQDFTASGEISQGLRIVVLLEGAVDVSYGGHRLQLQSPRAGAALPRATRAPRQSTRGMLLSLAETARFERRARRGAYARRLSVGMQGPWLEQLLGTLPVRTIEEFSQRHLAMHAWQPSSRVAAMAEQIVRAPSLSTPFLNLYIESRVLELVTEALGSLEPGEAAQPAPGSRLLPHEHERVRALHAFLQTEQAFELSLDELAREAGTNATTLQKQFRAAYGSTIFDFLREQRLQRARRALEREGVSVAQAAMLAGYTSPANFATAYRRRFGVPPKLARTRF